MFKLHNRAVKFHTVNLFDHENPYIYQSNIFQCADNENNTQAHLGDIEGSVLNHCHKANIAI